MSSILSPYSSSPPILSSLFKDSPESVPPTADLEALQSELNALKQITLERARKAGKDLRTIEESMRRLKEKEKGKSKAVDKIKKERACTSSASDENPHNTHLIQDTPVINGDEHKHSGATPLPIPKNVLPQFPVASTGASSSRSSLDPRPS